MTLVEMMFGMTVTSEMLTLDVAMHAATLLVIVAYFGPAWIRHIRRAPVLILFVGLACVPAVALYAGLGYLVESAKGSLLAVAAAFLVTAFGLLLAHAKTRRLAAEERHDIVGGANRRRSIIDVAIIGAAQAVALFPGVSRSGSTISAALLRKVGPHAAFEFSFLIGSPLMFGAVLLEGKNIAAMAETDATAILVGCTAAAASGLAALVALKHVVLANRLWVFGLYAGFVGFACLIVGVVRFALADGGGA
jgi:undecaprenyl-diphosphatase